MKAAYLAGLREFQFCERPDPLPGRDEVLLRVEAVGVCKSDVHYWAEGRIGDAVAKFPMRLGHEASGSVLKCGEGTDYPEGLRVAIEPGRPCRECRMCKQGRFNCCPKVRFLGSPGTDGAFADRLVVHKSQLVPLPDSMDCVEGALLEPLSVGFHAVRQSGFRLGLNACVLGAGPIGLATAMNLRVAGATKIFMTEPDSGRRANAIKHGFTVFDPADREWMEAVRGELNGEGVDYAFEAAGYPEAFQDAVQIAAIGGKAVLIGICSCDEVPLPMHVARKKELNIQVSRRDNQASHPVLEYAKQGRYPLDAFAVREYTLDRLQQAFESVHELRDGVVKAMIRP